MPMEPEEFVELIKRLPLGQPQATAFHAAYSKRRAANSEYEELEHDKYAPDLQDDWVRWVSNDIPDDECDPSIGRMEMGVRPAHVIYGRIQNAPLLVWLAEAVGMPAARVSLAIEAALAAGPISGTQCRAIRLQFPWREIQKALQQGRAEQTPPQSLLSDPQRSPHPAHDLETGGSSSRYRQSPRQESCRWMVGVVDRSKSHFELRYGSANDANWDQWMPVALVGPPRKRCFIVEFLVESDAPTINAIGKSVIDDLDFYIVEKREERPWDYLIYHCGTMANGYSMIHWSYHASDRRVDDNY